MATSVSPVTYSGFFPSNVTGYLTGQIPAQNFYLSPTTNTPRVHIDEEDLQGNKFGKMQHVLPYIHRYFHEYDPEIEPQRPLQVIHGLNTRAVLEKHPDAKINTEAPVPFPADPLSENWILADFKTADSQQDPSAVNVTSVSLVDAALNRYLHTEIDYGGDTKESETSRETTGASAKLVIKDNDVILRLLIDEHGVTQDSLGFLTSLQSLAHFVGEELQAGADLSRYLALAAVKIKEEEFPAHRSLGNKRFSHHYNFGGLKWKAKRSEVNVKEDSDTIELVDVIDNNPDIITQAYLDVSSSTQNFQGGKQTLIKLSLVKQPQLNLMQRDTEAKEDDEGRVYLPIQNSAELYVQVEIFKPQGEVFGPRLEIRSKDLKELITSVWSGQSYAPQSNSGNDVSLDNLV